MEASPISSVVILPLTRQKLLELLMDATQQLQRRPLVKYTALSFFADRFLPSLRRPLPTRRTVSHWLLQPPRESSLQLFALVAIWISSKVVSQIHDSRPLSVRSLKSLGDKLISDQHFTTRDFAEAELVFMEVLGFNIAASDVAFVFLEDLLIQFREISKIGDLVDLQVCLDIMDLLYEKEEISMLFRYPYSLAAALLVTAYIVSVPKQQWEFPLLPWVKFVTSYEEENIQKIVQIVLRHILEPDIQQIRRSRALCL